MTRAHSRRLAAVLVALVGAWGGVCLAQQAPTDPPAHGDDHAGATSTAAPAPTTGGRLTPPPVPPSLVTAPATAPSSPAPPVASDRPQDPRVLLGQAIDLYVVGRYAEAAARLRPLVETRVLSDRADQKEALRAYGISLFLSGGRAGSERAFRDLLRLDPKVRLDPQFVRPEVVKFFEEIRKKQEDELRDEVLRRGPQGPAVANLIPPWGQFQNGHRAKGWIILGGEVAFAAASITTAALLYSWRDSTGQFHEHADDYTAVSTVNYVTFAALAAVVVYGVVDGLYYYYRPEPVAGAADVGAKTPSLPAPGQGALFRF